MNVDRQTEAKGFTLIELMVVITLIGILAAVIIPEMRGSVEEARLRAATRELVGVFGVASSRAISRNQPHRVRIQPGTGRYLIEWIPEDEEGAGRAYVPLRDVPGAEGAFDRRIRVRVDDSDAAGSAGADAAGALAEGVDAGLEEGSPDGRTGAAGAPGLTVGFYPDGTADARDITLTDRDGFERVLRVNRVTGRVRIVDRPPAGGGAM